MKLLSVREQAICALFTAVICLCAVITVPLGAIPFTLGLLGIMLTALLLPPRCAVVSLLLYLALGVLGLPVFAGGNAGFSVLMGPTGGYLWSYPLVAGVVSTLAGPRRLQALAPLQRMLLRVLICEVGMQLCYLCGTVQYAFYAGISFRRALGLCVLPFLLPDLLKFLLASLMAMRLERVIRL